MEIKIHGLKGHIMDLTKGSYSEQEEEEEGRRKAAARPKVPIYQKIDFKNRLILYCFGKTPSKFAFFF